MRFLFLAADKFPPFRSDVAGLFGKCMLENGHHIDWILQSDRDLRRFSRTKWSGCQVWVGPTDNGTTLARRIKKHILDVVNDLRLFLVLRQNDYDFILVRDKFLTALIAIFASKIFGVRFVYWLSFPFPESDLYEVREGLARYPLLYRIRGIMTRVVLYRLVMPLACHSFVQTEQMKSQICLEGIPSEKMTAVPMGVSLDKIPFYGYSNDTDAEEKKVVYLGTLYKTRKMDFLVRAFAKVREGLFNVKLYLVGGGEDDLDEQIIRSEVDRLGLNDSVVITGFLDQRKAWEFVRKANVCVSPICPSPIYDCGSPTKLIEYMAMGKASVANEHPEQSRVLSESGAGICVPFDERAFAEAILKLLKNPEEARVMGLRGRAYVEKYRTNKAMADLIEEKLLALSRD